MKWIHTDPDPAKWNGSIRIRIRIRIHNTDLDSCWVVVVAGAGADVQQEDGEGCTALHHAAREGHFDIVAKLLELGAKVG